jgi:hypothetical protein
LISGGRAIHTSARHQSRRSYHCGTVILSYTAVHSRFPRLQFRLSFPIDNPSGAFEGFDHKIWIVWCDMLEPNARSSPAARFEVFYSPQSLLLRPSAFTRTILHVFLPPVGVRIHPQDGIGATETIRAERLLFKALLTKELYRRFEGRSIVAINSATA